MVAVTMLTDRHPAARPRLITQNSSTDFSYGRMDSRSESGSE